VEAEEVVVEAAEVVVEAEEVVVEVRFLLVLVVEAAEVVVEAAGTSRGRNIHHVLRMAQVHNHLWKNTLHKAHMGLLDLVLKNPLSGNSRKKINQQQ
jgi:hypothetical protein